MILNNSSSSPNDKEAERSHHAPSSNEGAPLYYLVVLGIYLIVIGVLWVLKNQGILLFDVHDWWPLILIGFGLLSLVKHRSIFNLPGWIFLLLGIFLFLTENHIVDKTQAVKYWPVLLIVFGIHIVFGRKSHYENRMKCCPPPFHQEETDETFPDETCTCDPEHEAFVKQSEIPVNEDFLNDEVIFGSIKRRIHSKNFRGGSVSALFGGVEIDFTDAELSPESAQLNVSATFGGIEIRVPRFWNVDTQISAFFGGTDRKCANPENTTGKRLIITGKAVFGGIEIKN